RVVVDKSWPGTSMKFLTMTGKVARAAVFAATFILSGSAWAGDHGDGNWLSRIIGSSNTPATNFAGSKGGKAVTKTEVFAGKSVLPMVSPSSDQAMSNAVARYEIIVSRGGWPEVSGSRLARGSSGPEVVRLRQRLAAEGYLASDSAAGENSQEYSDAVLRAVAQFQANHGLEVTGKVDKATADEMNVPASERLATLKANVPR